MPLYEYATIEDDGSEGEVFEVLQSMSEPALTAHPETGRPVRRLLSTPNAGRRGGASLKADMSDGNLEKLGFTKYRKGSGGTYEKTAGAGPDTISKE